MTEEQFKSLQRYTITQEIGPNWEAQGIDVLPTKKGPFLLWEDVAKFFPQSLDILSATV